jgi:hypothetical protein
MPNYKLKLLGKMSGFRWPTVANALLLQLVVLVLRLLEQRLVGIGLLP